MMNSYKNKAFVAFNEKSIIEFERMNPTQLSNSKYKK